MAPKTMMAMLCLLLALGPAATPVCKAADGEDKAFTLSFSTSSANSGDPVGVDIKGGTPGEFAWVFMVFVDGNPLILNLMRVKLDSKGDWSGSGTVPPVSGTVTLTFIAFTRDASGDPINSNLEPITVSP